MGQVDCLFQTNFEGLFLLPSDPLKSKYRKFRILYAALGYKGEFSDGWLDWLVGFFEADGTISTSGGRNYFVLTQKEHAILSEIFSTLGFGRLIFDKGVNAWRQIIDNTHGAALMILLLNGNLVIPYRIEQLAKAIDALNKSLANPRSRNFNLIEKVVLIETPLFPSLQNYWLCGFIDGEGCFNVGTNGNSVSIRFILDQNDFEDNLNLICNMFGGIGSIYLRKTLKKETWRLEIRNLSCLDNVIEYLNNFPLRSKKKQSFQKWANIYNMVLSGEANTAEGLALINQLKKDINPKD